MWLQTFFWRAASTARTRLRWVPSTCPSGRRGAPTRFRRAPHFTCGVQRRSRAHTRLKRRRGAFERVQPFFLIERDGKQNRFHGIVARLIGGRLRVGPHAPEQAVEIFLVLAAQRSPEFRPPRNGVVDELPECGYRAAHKIRDLPTGRQAGDW